MLMRRGFSYRAVQDAALKMKMGIRPLCCISDRLSDEDIEQAWRKASMRVFGNKSKHE